jgi:hypothetical protein
MATTNEAQAGYWKIGFVFLMAIIGLWIASQVVGQAGAADYLDSNVVNSAVEVASASRAQVSEAVTTSSPAHPTVDEAEAGHGWFIDDEESQWTAEEQANVEKIMEHTWQALDSVGLNGQRLLDGYRFRRAAAEFVPGEERLLAVVYHEAKEIVLANGAFKRLHGFYIYHELGHAVDHQLGRLPSEAYHRIASASQDELEADGDAWSTTTGFWLRYHGRDDREEATADAFAWWVMAQADQPQPFFPGTPVTTDYAEIAQTIEAAVREAVASI